MRGLRLDRPWLSFDLGTKMPVLSWAARCTTRF